MIRRCLRHLAAAAGTLGAVLLALLLLAVFTSVVLREVFHVAYAWLSDVTQWGLLWTIFIGAVRLAFRNEHISMDALYTRLGWGMRRLINVLVALVAIGVGAYVCFLGVLDTRRVLILKQTSQSGFIPAWIGHMVIPLAFGLMVVGYVHYLVFVAWREDEQPSAGGDEPF